MQDVAEDRRSRKAGKAEQRRSPGVLPKRFVRLPTRMVGKILDFDPRKNDDGDVTIFGHARANAIKVLAIKLAAPNQVLNRENVNKRYRMGWRRFNEGLTVLKDRHVLEREQKGHRTFATERIIGHVEGVYFVPLDKALLPKRSTLVAFVATVNLLPNPVRPEEVAGRFGITSPTTIRGLVRDARADGHVAYYQDPISGKILVARSGYEFGDTISDRGVVKCGFAKNGVHIEMGESNEKEKQYASIRRIEVIRAAPALQPSATPMACASPDSDSRDWRNPPASELAARSQKELAARSQKFREGDNPYSSRVLLGWISDTPMYEAVFDLLGGKDQLIAELAEAYPDATLRALIKRATAGRVGWRLLTAGGLYAARYLAAVVMARVREDLDVGGRPEDDSALATPQGAMKVILRAMCDRIGSRPGKGLGSYALIGKRLAGEIYGGFAEERARLYRPRPTEQQLADGTGGDDGLRIVLEAGGHTVLVSKLQDGADATAALLAFLDDESGKNGCRRVDVLAAVVRVMQSFVSHGWKDGEGRKNVQVSSWGQFAEAVAAEIMQRSKAAC